MLQCLHAKRHALESWRQLVEIILTACPQDLIQAEDRQLIIRDLLQDVHDKVTFPKLLYAAKQILIPFKYIVCPTFFSILDCVFHPGLFFPLAKVCMIINMLILL